MPNHPQRKADPGREVVRVGRLERTLERFNAEMGQKTALTVSDFYGTVIDRRLRRIERLWWNRIGLFFTDLWDWLLWKLGPKPAGMKVRSRVKTTEIGKKHFEGEETEGVITAIGRDRLCVLPDGQDTEMWYSPSVWEALKPEMVTSTATGEDPGTAER
jgi:hypothetical protein